VPLSLPFATVGALIATRHRHNPIGWLLCGSGSWWLCCWSATRTAGTRW